MADEDGTNSGVITRRGLIGIGGLLGGFVAAGAAWQLGPILAVLVGVFAALGAAAALHELLPKNW
jgi:hypothetical protein